MTLPHPLSRVTRWVAASFAVTGAAYSAYVGAAWLRYGHPKRSTWLEADDLLDRFMPRFDVAECHNVVVAAPADLTFAASMDMDPEDSAIVRAIFKGREIMLGADAGPDVPVRGLVAVTKALGWGVLAERPGRELVMGAVTQPWEANVKFQSLPPSEFAVFDRPGFVKIAWTLRADPMGPNRSVARTETRAVATDAEARRKFRWYWARFSAGIVLIRLVSMRLVKAAAEKRARAAARVSHNAAWERRVGSL
jgi:hypothetical protein